MRAQSWQQIARRQSGVIAHRQLRASGLSPQAIATLCARGHLQRRVRGVFLAAAAPVTYEAQLWCAHLTTSGVLGFRTAVHLWGMVEEPGDRVDVIVDHVNGHRGGPDLRVHRRWLDPRQVTLRHGWTITTKTCSALDHLGSLSQQDAVPFADRGLQQGWFVRRDLERRLRNEPGRTGNARLREILAISADGAAAESERVLHRLLNASRISGWVANFDVWSDGELVLCIDVAFPDHRLAIEVDGMAFHSSAERFQRDRSRQNRLVGLGWTVLRFTWGDLVRRPDYVVSTIAHAIRGS